MIVIVLEGGLVSEVIGLKEGEYVVADLDRTYDESDLDHFNDLYETLVPILGEDHPVVQDVSRKLTTAIEVYGELES